MREQNRSRHKGGGFFIIFQMKTTKMAAGVRVVKGLTI
jgi:hypothetical protein